MRISVMQAEAAVLDADANLRRIDEAARAAADDGADVLVTPELFVTGYAPTLLHEFDDAEVTRIEERLGEIANRHRLAVVASYPRVVASGQRRQQRIVATLVGADGVRLLEYDKVNLFDGDERAAFTPGGRPPSPVTLAGLRVALVVCFDVEYPEMVRTAALAGADVLLVPTALTSGFDDVPEILVRARALENGVGIAYANHVGQENGLTFGGGSVIVGPDGGVLAQAGTEPVLLTADVTARDVAVARDAVPYLTRLRSSTYDAWG